MSWFSRFWMRIKPAHTDNWHVAWHIFERVLRDNIRQRTRQWKLIVVSTTDRAERQEVNGETRLVIGSAWDWHQLESFGLAYRRHVESKPEEAMIEAELAGTDQDGIIYVNLSFAHGGRGADFYRVETHPDWDRKAALALRKDIEAGTPGVADLQEFNVDDLFTEEGLRRVADWDSIVPGYDRNVPDAQCWVLNEVLLPFVRDLEASREFKVGGSVDWGYATYVSVHIRRKGEVSDDTGLGRTPTGQDGWLSVFFSLCAPVAVLLRITGWLRSDDVVNVEEVSSELGAFVMEALEKTPYKILTREQVNRPLPEGIDRLYGTRSASCPQPAATVFDVLFQWED